jgi:hypothetical protein
MLTTDTQSWNKAPIWGLRPDSYYCQTVAGLLMWSALSDERTGLSFTIAFGPLQYRDSWFRVPCAAIGMDSADYIIPLLLLLLPWEHIY